MALWYLTRGTGIVALLLLTLSVGLGIVEVKQWHSPGFPRFVTAGLHRNVSLLSVAFVAVHVATTVVDGFAPIGWLDAVVPFHSPYRPLWLGLGALSSDLLLALIVTSLLRRRLGYRSWKAVHWAAYACWPIALVHGLGTGTDVRQGWALGLYGLCLAAVIAAVGWRLVGGWDDQRRPAAVASVVVPVAIVAWLLAGPLQPGWSERAGTPPAVLPVASVNTAPSTTVVAFSLPVTAGLQGRLAHSLGSDGTETLTIDAALSTPAGARLVIVMRGNPLPSGGITLSTSQVTIGLPGAPAAYQGTVTALVGRQLTFTVTGPGGQRVFDVELSITGAGGVSGTLNRDLSGG